MIIRNKNIKIILFMIIMSLIMSMVLNSCAPAEKTNI